MTAPTALIADYMHQVEKRDAQIGRLQSELVDTQARAIEAERAWAAALNRERKALERLRLAEEELAWLRKELEQEAD